MYPQGLHLQDKSIAIEVPLKDDEFTALVGELESIANDTQTTLVDRARDAAAAKFCVWNGQSSDGRKYGSKDGKTDAYPYNGAPDQRIRLVDFVCKFRAALCMAAAKDGTRSVAPMELSDAGFSGYMQTLLKWTLDNHLGGRFWVELMRVCNWVEGSHPGAAVLHIYWHQTTTTDAVTVTLDQLVANLAQSEDPESPVDPAGLQAALQGPGGATLTASALQSLYPSLTPADARRAARELIATGTTSFGEPVIASAGPRVCALQLYNDIFLPPQTLKDINDSEVVYIREMLSEVALRERVVTQGYSQEFVDSVLGTSGGQRVTAGYKGQSFLNTAWQNAENDLRRGEGGLSLGEMPWKNQYEILTAYYRAIGPTGHAAIYYVPFSGLAKKAAHGRRLLPYANGKYPFAFFSSEYHSNLLLGARSTASQLYQDQTAYKKLADSAVAHAEITALPPLEKHHSITRVAMGPLAENPVRTMGQIRGIDLPARATGAVEQMDTIDKRVARFYGIPHAEVPPEVTQVLQRSLVDHFLVGYQTTLTMVLQLCQQFYTAEDISLITGARPDQVAIPRPEAIRKQFNLSISFDPRVLSGEYQVRLMEFATKIVALDTKGVLLRDRLVAAIARSIDPQLADFALQPVEQADGREAEIVRQDFTKIMSGVMPEMPEQGVNYALRLEVLQQIITQNPFLSGQTPGIPSRLTPDQDQALDQYTAWLEQGIEQEQNAQIGRLGTSPELDVEAAMANAGEAVA